MAQKNKSGKAGRMSVDVQKATNGKKDVKLPALGSPSPSKKFKEIPMPSKPIPPPNEGATTMKISTPKSPTARSAPIKLSTPIKPPSRQATQDPKDSRSGFPSAVSDIPPTTESRQSTNTESLSISTEDLAAVAVQPSADDIAAAEAIAAAEETERLRKLNGNGMVTLVYESYDELFPIENGSTTQANIDEIYCLSFVMPNCLVRLSRHPNPERFQREESGVFDSLVCEEPRGTYQDLEKDHTYYVVVEQEADQLRRDQEATKALWGEELQKQKISQDDGRGFESCSCIYGNPCVDEYGCRDWHSRFAIATKNGWKGF